jgi:hypothetical protein
MTMALPREPASAVAIAIRMTDDVRSETIRAYGREEMERIVQRQQQSD